MIAALLMTADDDDIIAETLEWNRQHFDALYTLDGSDQPSDGWWTESNYWRDTDVPYDPPIRDGWRQFLYEQAVEDLGCDHWFMLLHSDEKWMFNPREVEGADGFIFRLPCFIPRDPWDDTKTPLEQLVWRLGPGWPEFRFFHGNPQVAFNPEQHFNTCPNGLQHVTEAPGEIFHYPYRSPDCQRLRARRHLRTGFDPDNYRHILDRDEVTWSDAMIEKVRQRPEFRDLHGA